MKPQINHNVFWAEVTVKLLESLGVKNVVISPGSRSAPFVFAFSKSKKIKNAVVVDERDNGFFALGLAKASRVPTAIVTTSGTAVAELYPAIIEAFNARIPLFVITSDRPEYLYGTGANQTINQINIYKNHIRKFVDFNASKPTKAKVDKLKKEITGAFEIATIKDAGPVHFNFHFEKPFEPDAFTTSISKELYDYSFSNKIDKKTVIKKKEKSFTSFARDIIKNEKGIILTGGGYFSKKDIKSILKFAETAKYPIFADGISQFRFSANRNKNVSVNQTAFLKSRKIDPDIIFQFGTAPTGNVLLSFFKESKTKKIIVNPFGDLSDPSRTASKIIRADFSTFTESIVSNLNSLNYKRKKSAWFEKIVKFETAADELKNKIIGRAKFPFEGRIIIELLKQIPDGSNLFVSNSAPARDIDFFAGQAGKDISIFTNRGASGIDGIVSTALGVAKASGRKTYLLVGDLALFHDLNALWIAKNYDIPITIILVDNNGGGIFHLLPVADYPSVFEKYFNTPMNLNFKKLITAHGFEYRRVTSWNSFAENLSGQTSKKRIVLRIKSDSAASKIIRQKYWDSVKNALADF